METDTIYAIAGMTGAVGYLVGKGVWKHELSRVVDRLVEVGTIIQRTYSNKGYDCVPSNGMRMLDYDRLKEIREELERYCPNKSFDSINSTRHYIEENVTRHHTEEKVEGSHGEEKPSDRQPIVRYTSLRRKMRGRSRK